MYINMVFLRCFCKWRFSATISFLVISLSGNAQDENESSWFGVKSRTVFLSAKCVIDEADEEEDRERKNVGIGETVDLVVNGKALNDSEVVVEWVLTDGEDISGLEKDDEDGKRAKLVIKKEGRRAGSVTIEAKAKKNGAEIAAATISFNVKLPTGIEARHSGYRVDGHPVDGDKVNMGASSKLILILEPLTVSFCNIQIKEKAEDSEGGGWIGEHDVGGNSARPNDRNEVEYDQIGVRGATVSDMQAWPHFGDRSVWLCGWYTYSGGINHHKISGRNYEQSFMITEDGLRPPPPELGRVREIKASVNKFGRTVTRSTAGSASHQDS